MSLAHVGDVKQAGTLPHGCDFAHRPTVGDGHVPTGEWDHGRAERRVGVVERGSFSQCLVVGHSPRYAFLDVVIREERFGVVGHDDMAGLQHVAVVRHTQRLVGVLLDQQDGDALPVDVLDDVEDVTHQERGQAERRLVQQQEFRPAHQGTGHSEHLLFTPGHGAGVLADALLQAREQAQDAVIVLPDARRVFAGVGPKFQVLAHGHVGEHAAPLGRMPDAEFDDLIGGQSRNIFAFEHDAPGSLLGTRPEIARKCRAFPGTVGADQGDDLSCGDGQRDARKGPDRTVGDRQVFDGQHRSGHLRSGVGLA